MFSKINYYYIILHQILFIHFKILLFNSPITKQAKIGVFEVNSLDDLPITCKPILVDSSRNEYHQVCDFEMVRSMAAGTYGFGKIGIAPLLNITNECREKLLKKNPYAKEVLAYKIFRFRESDPIHEPNNKKLGVTHVYEGFFQLFYFRGNGIDKYTKVDVEGVCGEKISMFLLHNIENEIMSTNFKNVQNQCPIKAPVPQFLKWYDTLNPNSDFYHSICIGYTYNTLVDNFLKNETTLKYYDTPLNIRKKYFFGNLYLCPDYCTYSGIFVQMGLLLITCHCVDPKLDLLSNISKIQEPQYMQPFDFDEDKFFSTKHDSFFSIGVLGCYMFTFILGLQNNYGCYIILGIAAVIIFSFVELIVFGKKRILSILELLYFNNINIHNKNNINININNLNNSNEKIFNNKSDNFIISLSNKGELESNDIKISKNIKTPNNNLQNGYIQNNIIQKTQNKNMKINNNNINNNSKNNNFNKKIKEKYVEIEKGGINKYEDLNKKETKMKKNIYDNNTKINKKENSIKKFDTNVRKEEESEDSDNIKEGKIKEDIKEEQNSIKNIEKNEEEEEEWEDEEEEEEDDDVRQNANPPKFKMKMKRNINNELSSNQKLNHERENNQIPQNTNNYDIQNTKKKSNRNKISSNTYNSKFSKENEKQNIENEQKKEKIENNQKMKKDMKKTPKKTVTFKDNENLKIGKILVTDKNNFPYIPKSDLYFVIDNIFSDQELNSMDYLHFLKYDKRTFFQMYYSFLNYQSPLFFLLHYYNSCPNENYTFQIKYPSAKLIYFCIEIYICFFFNATVFGTKSAAYQFYGTYTFWKHLAFGIILSPFCLIVNNFFHFLLFHNVKTKIIEIKIWCFTKLIIDKRSKIKDSFDYFTKKEYVSKYHRTITKIEDIHPSDIDRRIKHDKRELKNLIMDFLKIYQKKINTSIFFTCLGIILMWYYVTSLCVAFKNSQGNFLLNVLLTFIFCNLIPIAYCFLPAYVRNKALIEKNKYFFIISQILRIF